MPEPRDVPLQRAYRPPASPDVIHEPVGADHDTIVARLALGWLGSMLLLHVASTAVMQWELFDAPLNGSLELHRAALEFHSAGTSTIVLPLAMGIAATLVLRKAMGWSRTAAPWLGYVALAGWVTGSVLALAVPRLEAGHTFYSPRALVDLGFWIGAALSCGLVAAALNVGWTLWTRRQAAVLWRNPLALGLGVGALLQLVAFARSCLHFAGSQLDVPTLGSGLVTLDDLVHPVGFGLAYGLLDRPRPERRWVSVAIVAVGAYDFLPGPGWGALLPTFGLALASAGLVRFVLRGPRTPAGWCAAGALVSLGYLASVEGFLLALSDDVHLHDTTFVSQPAHLAAFALLLALLGWAFQGRAWPSRAWRIVASSAVVGMIVGLLGASFGLGVLGQQGMPRYYAAYIEMFEPWHRAVALAGSTGLLLAIVAVVALVRGTKPS